MTTDEIKTLVLQKASEWGIDPGVALAQIQRESGFNPRAVGSSGERGLAQFMPGTWAQYGSGSFDNAFDPSMNLDAWGYYMTTLLGQFGNGYTQALTAYNGGPGHLTAPGRYGPPSSAAVAYGQALAAQSSYDVTAPAGSPNQPGLSNSNLTVFLVLGLGLIVAFVAFRD